LLITSRAMMFLLVTLALGPGVMANWALKEHWGRSRPFSVVEFGGQDKFTPWWKPSDQCQHNCSFVSGDVSAATWAAATAALTPPPWRALAFGATFAFAGAMALMRFAIGAHFFTDGLFAGVFTFLIVWLVHGAIYRWPRTRFTDDDLESQMERAQRWWAEMLG